VRFTMNKDKYHLMQVVKSRRRSLPGIEDFVWAALRQVDTPFGGPWSHATIIEQVEEFELGLTGERLTLALLDADQDHKWRKEYKPEPEEDSIFDTEEVEIVEYIEEQHKPVEFYDVVRYWQDTHKS